ncbi:hypothetical protein B0T13DRAFT_3229 [Neurospora crassa]|nr:hypothetical protein B0T13DRAFT_3229 [Neurospora crassa]
MRSLSLLPTVLLSLTTLANAHFLFNYPPSLEGASIDEDKEPDAPCGAKTPNLSSDTTTTDFHVDGDFISLYAGHPQFTWLYRASVQEVSEGNWTQLFPIVQQSGLGDFCSTQVKAPKEWVGKKGVVGVAGIGGDGTLFQCAIVNFVEGTNANMPSACKNSTGVTAAYTSDADLTKLVGDHVEASPSASGTGAAPAPTTTDKTKNAGVVVRGGGGLAALGAAVVAGVMML